MMIFVYLASPYSHEDSSIRLQREVLINDIAADLHERFKDVTFFLPITQSTVLCKQSSALKSTFEEWKERDLFLIREKCDGLWVVMLEGWDKSIGVMAEIECARKYNKIIKYYNYRKREFENE